MRLVQFSTSTAGPSPGVLRPSGDVVPVSSILGDRGPRTVRELLSGGPEALKLLRARLKTANTVVDADEVLLEAPLDRGVLVVCAGANYRAHVEEMGPPLPGNSLWFIKNSNAIVGPGADIVLPDSAPDQVDWEGELAVVIGRPCHSVAAADALDYVAGLTLLNDVSARDDVAAMTSAMTTAGAGSDCLLAGMRMFLGKQYPTFAPLGPAVVTLDEVPDIRAIRLTTTVNGKLMQDAHVADLTVDIAGLIEAYSRFFQFEPGDVISTGSPPGAGAAQSPPQFLADGDVVTVAGTGIGELTNGVRR